jgi:hypothetical protein
MKSWKPFTWKSGSGPINGSEKTQLTMLDKQKRKKEGKEDKR